MEARKQELADLYFDSGSVQFGAFRLTAHQADPTLPLSPLYLHYPKLGWGIKRMPRLHELVGELFFEITENMGILFDRIGAVPKGAQPLAKNLAARFVAQPDILVEFGKDLVGGQNHFFPVKGSVVPGRVLLGVEDHTSGGHNKRLFKEGVEAAGMELKDFLTVVDREQGAAGYLSSIGVGFYRIFTIRELLAYYAQVGKITQARADECELYLAANQLWVPSNS